MKYHIWRHHKLVLDNATFEECKAFLNLRDENNYMHCTHALHIHEEDNMEKSLQGQLWMTEYASIKPTKKTAIELNQLIDKVKMEEIDHKLTYGE